MDSSREMLVRQQFSELVQVYSGLTLRKNQSGQWFIRGLLSFAATYHDVTISDEFSVVITLPDDYPDSPPTVMENGGRIPADFHQYPNRTLCLGAPVEVRRRFRSDPRLLAFVETLVIPYLYAYAYWVKHGTMPFGELSHGCQGIREYYQDMFNTQDVRIVLAMLKVLGDGTYRGHHPCPCGSGKILRKCHGPLLLDLMRCQPGKRFIDDAQMVLCSLDSSELAHLDPGLLPRELRQEFDERARAKARREKYA